METDGKIEFFEVEIPRRKVRVKKETQVLIDMEVNKTAMAFFPLPEGMAYEKFAARVANWISCARKMTGSTFVKRYIDLDGRGEGCGVWKTK